VVQQPYAELCLQPLTASLRLEAETSPNTAASRNPPALTAKTKTERSASSTANAHNPERSAIILHCHTVPGRPYFCCNFGGSHDQYHRRRHL
jgi:hypothetical protein